jgi:Asp-tRNA(Asn)/Glu-tRNA(Gln) amidotransferase A subunit family amidase
VSHPQDLTLHEQAAALAGGELDPAELLRATLERIAERPETNSVAATFPEESERMLAEAPDGPLKGVPILVKDMFTLPWRAPRDGTENEHLPAGESAVYARLRDAGAVVAGVTNRHWNGAGTTGVASAYGPVGSAADPEHCGGGSSGGSGAAVGAHLAAGAVGSDGGGSIRFPAAYNGVFGIKPTFGAVPATGFTHGYLDLGQAGPLTRDAADARLLAQVLMGRELPRGDGAGLRAGIVPYFWADLDPAVEAGCRALLEAGGWEVTELELRGAEHILICTVLALTMTGIPSMHGDAPPNLVAEALAKYIALIPARAMPRVDRVRSLLRRQLADIFEKVDVLVWPTVPAPPPRIDNPTVELPSGPQPADVANVPLCGLANLSGIPAASVPAGEKDGLPFGLQLQAAWGAEARLLDAAEHLESA